MEEINTVIEGKYKGCEIGYYNAYRVIKQVAPNRCAPFCQTTVKEITELDIEWERPLDEHDRGEYIYTARVDWQDGEYSILRLQGSCYDSIVNQAKNYYDISSYCAPSYGFGGDGGGSFGLGEIAGIFTGLKIGGFFD